MADLYLTEHVRFCEVGERRIFLDLVADRYFCLPPALDSAFAEIARGSDAAVGPARDQLRGLGVLIEASDGRPIAPTRHPLPDSSLVEEADVGGELGLLILAEVLVRVVRARHAVRRRRLAAELTATPDTRSLRGTPRDLVCAVQTFLRARRLVPIAPNCLYDSVALRRFLRSRGIETDLVIGVKLDPFAAHCWVQDQRVVLNDSLGSARDFVPILVA